MQCLLEEQGSGAEGGIPDYMMEGAAMLKVGDRVKINDKYRGNNVGKVFTVIAGPQEVCGTTCVWLKGFSGCYAVDGLDKVSDSGNVFLSDRYVEVCRYMGYPICTLKEARPAEGDKLGYVIDDSKFEGQIFEHPEEAMAAISNEYL